MDWSKPLIAVSAAMMVVLALAAAELREQPLLFPWLEAANGTVGVTTR